MPASSIHGEGRTVIVGTTLLLTLAKRVVALIDQRQPASAAHRVRQCSEPFLPQELLRLVCIAGREARLRSVISARSTGATCSSLSMSHLAARSCGAGRPLPSAHSAYLCPVGCDSETSLQMVAAVNTSRTLQSLDCAVYILSPTERPPQGPYPTDAGQLIFAYNDGKTVFGSAR